MPTTNHLGVKFCCTIRGAWSDTVSPDREEIVNKKERSVHCYGSQRPNPTETSLGVYTHWSEVEPSTSARSASKSQETTTVSNGGLLDPNT